MLFEQNIASNVTRNQEPKHIKIKKTLHIPMHIRTQPYTPVHICTHPPPLIYPSRYTRTYHLAKTKKTVLHKASIGIVHKLPYRR